MDDAAELDQYDTCKHRELYVISRFMQNLIDISLQSSPLCIILVLIHKTVEVRQE